MISPRPVDTDRLIRDSNVYNFDPDLQPQLFFHSDYGFRLARNLESDQIYGPTTLIDTSFMQLKSVYMTPLTI